MGKFVILYSAEG